MLPLFQDTAPYTDIPFILLQMYKIMGTEAIPLQKNEIPYK